MELYKKMKSFEKEGKTYNYYQLFVKIQGINYYIPIYLKDKGLKVILCQYAKECE